MPVFACSTFYVLTVKNCFSGLMVNCKFEMVQRMQYIESVFLRFSFCRWKMGSSKLLVIFLPSLPLSTDAFLGAKHFNRDDKRGERHAYFVKDPAKRLNSSILDCFMVSEPMGCFFRCISYQECYSVNFASVS